jgi:hypothetical protein
MIKIADYQSGNMDFLVCLCLNLKYTFKTPNSKGENKKLGKNRGYSGL